MRRSGDNARSSFCANNDLDLSNGTIAVTGGGVSASRARWFDDTAQLLAIGYSEAAPTILSDDVFCMNAAAPRWLADQEGSRSTRTSFSTAWVPSSSNAGSNFLTV